jgi:YD repeat-containing protein
LAEGKTRTMAARCASLTNGGTIFSKYHYNNRGGWPTLLSPPLKLSWGVPHPCGFCKGGWAVGLKIDERRTLNGVTKDSFTSHNLAGLVRRVKHPSGRMVEYEFDSAGRVTLARDLSSGLQYASSG